MRLLLFAFIVMHAFTAAQTSEYETLFEKFAAQTPDVTKAYSVDGIFLQQPDCVISLDSGVIVFSTPVNGRVFSATFIGKGTIEYTPPIAVERGQMKRFLGTETYSKEVRGFFFCFTDSTMQQIIGSAAPVKLSSLPELIRDYFQRGFESVIYDKKYKYLPSPALYSLASDVTPWFMAMIFPPKEEPARYEYNSREFEGVSFGKVENSQHSFNKIMRGLTSHYPGYRYEQNINNDDDGEYDDITPVHYGIDCSIAANLDMDVQVIVTAIIKHSGLRWTNLWLHNKLNIDTLLLNGQSVDYIHLPEQSLIYIKLPKLFLIGDSIKFVFKYHGTDVITRLGNYVYMDFITNWYPKVGRQAAYYDLTFHTDEKYKFVSIGRKISENRIDDIITTKWRAEVPVRYVSFNIGPFDKKNIPNESNIPMTLYTLSSRMAEQVSQDIGLSFRFYEKLFGQRADITELSVSEIPKGHGLAFPGMLHLSYSAFRDGRNDGTWESFCAHEVAHQWWPMAVEYKTYRDVWLSEAMAEYSSWMYTQIALKDNEKFFKFLRDNRDRLIKERNKALDGEKGYGAIALGSRLGSGLVRNEYFYVVYEKGAWMLHMLRNMFLDLKTMKEDGFLNLLADYHKTFAGKKASTDDFRKLVEKHSGTDCTWFFKQWYEGTDIPTYEFASRYTKTPEGKYKISVQIAQKHVPPDFRAFVPIKVEFDDNKFVRLSANVTGATMLFDLPPLPFEPKKIVFNDLESVLCEVKNVDWKE